MANHKVKNRKQKKKKLPNPYIRKFSPGLHIAQAESPPINPFPVIDPTHWEEGKILNQWISGWRNIYGLSEQKLEQLKTKFQTYYEKGWNVFFVQIRLSDIVGHHKRSGTLSDVPRIRFKEHQPITDRLAVTERRMFTRRAKKRATAFRVIREQCRENGVDETPLLQIAQELKRRELAKVQIAVQRICDLDSYRRSIKISKGKKFTNPLLANEIRCLVDYFSSVNPRYKYKGALPEVTKLLNLTGVSVSKKTIDRYCTLAKSLPCLPFPHSPSN